MEAGGSGCTLCGGRVRVIRTPYGSGTKRSPVRPCSSLPMRRVSGSVTSWADVCEPRETAVTAGAATAMTNSAPRFLHPALAPKKKRRLTRRQRISGHDTRSAAQWLAARLRGGRCGKATGRFVATLRLPAAGSVWTKASFFVPRDLNTLTAASRSAPDGCTLHCRDSRNRGCASGRSSRS